MTGWTVLARWAVTHTATNGPDVSGDLERLECPAGHREVVVADRRPDFCMQCEPGRWVAGKEFVEAGVA
jgi:hypothetical protein